VDVEGSNAFFRSKIGGIPHDERAARERPSWPPGRRASCSDLIAERERRRVEKIEDRFNKIEPADVDERSRVRDGESIGARKERKST
jgi:hypothetical protein